MSDDANKVEEELRKSLSHYRETLSFMGANAPIEVLCLPRAIENALIKAGYLRVYDLIRRDLSEIEGIGPTRRGILAARLDEFFTIPL